MKKIGLLLGSFDPIHIAHGNMAACVLNSGLCDKVLFVVAQHNPWKKAEPASYDLRCKMVESAIEPLGDKAEVCRFEEEFEPPVYSYLPISKALETYPEDEIIIIAGTDTIDKIPRWRNFDTHIKGKVGFIEIKRGDYNSMANASTPFGLYVGVLGDNTLIKRLSIQRMDVSSTMVRNMILSGMNPYPYVTKEVLKIIQDNDLYKNG
jgi:nicotinate-nucleotide adenylyltransferase